MAVTRSLTPPSCTCAGRLVIELFDDIAPVAVTHFRNRCSGRLTLLQAML